MNKLAVAISLALISTLLFSLCINPVNSSTQNQLSPSAENPYALFLIENGTVYKNHIVQLTLFIRNPSSFYLKNVSLYILFPLETSLISNSTSTETNITTDIVEEGKNVTIFIPLIEKNSTYTLIFQVKFVKTGTFEIVTSNIKAVKNKGEYKEDLELELNNLVITVVEPPSVLYPPEGTKDFTYVILLFLVVIPISVLSFGHKIAWKE